VLPELMQTGPKKKKKKKKKYFFSKLPIHFKEVNKAF
jgi:hypothetical protein